MSCYLKLHKSKTDLNPMRDSFGNRRDSSLAHDTLDSRKWKQGEFIYPVHGSNKVIDFDNNYKLFCFTFTIRSLFLLLVLSTIPFGHFEFIQSMNEKLARVCTALSILES